MMKITLHQLKRIGIGLLAMTAASIALAFVPSLFPFVPFAPANDPFFMSQPMPTVEQSLKMAVAAFVGAYVARVPFVVATIIYYAGVTVYAFHILTLIAEPIEPVTIFEVTARNSIGAAIGLVAAVIGANVGFRLSNARLHRSPGAR